MENTPEYLYPRFSFVDRVYMGGYWGRVYDLPEAKLTIALKLWDFVSETPIETKDGLLTDKGLVALNMCYMTTGWNTPKSMRVEAIKRGLYPWKPEKGDEN